MQVNYDSLPEGGPRIRTLPVVLYFLIVLPLVLFTVVTVSFLFVPDENSWVHGASLLTAFILVVSIPAVRFIRSSWKIMDVRVSSLRAFARDNAWTIQGIDAVDVIGSDYLVPPPLRDLMTNAVMQWKIDGVVETVPFDVYALTTTVRRGIVGTPALGFFTIVRVPKDWVGIPDSDPRKVYAGGSFYVTSDETYKYISVPYNAYKRPEMESLLRSTLLF